MKHYHNGPAPIRSAGNMLAESGLFKRDSRTHWSAQKRVPREIAWAREQQEHKAEVAAIVEAHRIQKPELGLFVAKVPTGFKLRGHGQTVATFEEVKAFAQENGRGFIKMGGISVRVTR